MATLLTTTPLTTQPMQQFQPAPVVPTAPVVTVVPAWNPEAYQDATNRHEFILVGDPSRNRVTIQDSYDIWANMPNVLFQTGYRIAGTRENIIAALQEAQTPDDQIEAAVNSSISSENYITDMAPEFHREMADYIAWHRTAVKTNTAAPGNTLSGTMAALNPAFAATTAQAKPRAAGTGGPGRKVESITQKLQKATADKPYLDVSNMDDFGRKTKWLAPGSLAGRVGTNRIAIVSNKLDRYVAAIRMIPGGEQTYADDIAHVAQLLGGTVPAGAAFPQPGQQVPTGAVPATSTHGFQPFAPQPMQDIRPTPVSAILTPKQRKQKKAAAAQLNIAPNFSTAVMQPIAAFPGQIGVPVNVANYDDESDYDDDDEAPIDFTVNQVFPQQPRMPSPQVPRFSPMSAAQQPRMSSPQVPLFPPMAAVQQPRMPSPQVPRFPAAPTQAVATQAENLM